MYKGVKVTRQSGQINRVAAAYVKSMKVCVCVETPLCRFHSCVMSICLVLPLCLCPAILMSKMCPCHFLSKSSKMLPSILKNRYYSTQIHCSVTLYLFICDPEIFSFSTFLRPSNIKIVTSQLKESEVSPKVWRNDRAQITVAPSGPSSLNRGGHRQMYNLTMALSLNWVRNSREGNTDQTCIKSELSVFPLL